jgi:hypothetical protein
MVIKAGEGDKKGGIGEERVGLHISFIFDSPGLL